MTAPRTLAAGACALFVAVSSAAPGDVVAFKDAAKIKSWDAWDEKAPPQANRAARIRKERRSVTWQTLNTLSPGLKEIGRLAVRDAKDITSSKWSIGCETMDRDYADWNAYKHLIAPLGVKHGRLFSGWAKTEQKKGTYDFTWLDPHVRELAAMGVRPWICLAYGNPVYGSDFRLGMKVAQVTRNPEAFAAWLTYCTACVQRYKDVVDAWEVWNEPFHQGADYAELFYRTARAIRAVQPEAKIFCTAVQYKKDYVCVLEKLKKENALDLGSYFIYHPYDANPDVTYGRTADGLRRLVKSYSGAFDILQGESGCPSQLEFAHALSNIEWSEYAQAKWLLRRTIGDAARNIPSSVFTLIDLQYTFMLQSFGLVRSNTLKECVYRRPSYYALQNVFGLLDDEAHPEKLVVHPAFTDVTKHDPRDTRTRALTSVRFSRFGKVFRFIWFSDSRPSSTLAFDTVTLRLPGVVRRPVWVDMITGRVFEIPAENVAVANNQTVIRRVPMWDSPVMIADRLAVPMRKDWRKMTPYQLVDSLYRPGQFGNRMKAMPPPDSQRWMKMATTDFLPFIDRYGQFRWRDWPGKTASDADLTRAAAEEKKDLDANPGPSDWNRFGGWARGPHLKATGRFRTEKIDGRWWFVDPDGRLFWSFGVMRVSASTAMTPMNGDPLTPRTGYPIPDRDCFFAELPPAPGAPDATAFSTFWTTRDELLWPFYEARGETRVFDFSSANLYRKYGPNYVAAFTDIAHRRLRSWCVNTISSSSDKAVCDAGRTPYYDRVERQSRFIDGSATFWFKFRDPWDPTFRTSVLTALAARGRQGHDPMCLGFSIDNEIAWGAHPAQLAEWTLRSPADQPAKAALVGFMKNRYATVAKLNAAWRSSYTDWDDLLQTTTLPGAGAQKDLTAFTSVIVEEYFRRTRDAVKEFDPQLLYLGCRFAGVAHPWVIGPCAKYSDVITYNIYRRDLSRFKLPAGVTDKPVMVTEFHFGSTDRGPFGASLVPTADQNDRAEKIKAYVRSAIAHPQIVGVHWHQYSDQATTGRFDGEHSQVGWTDICDRPYAETVAALREVGREIYSRGSRRTGGRVPTHVKNDSTKNERNNGK
jgi:hypothetical protein